MGERGYPTPLPLRESEGPIAQRWEGEGMKPKYSYKTLTRAQSLRREMTDAEIKLWSILRSGQLDGAKFRRQQPIGPFIVDFVCQQRRLIIEADGSQHCESETDGKRDAFLRAKGYRVMRFWNSDILGSIEAVGEEILRALSGPHPPTAARRAPPSPSGGEGFTASLPLSPTPLPRGERGFKDARHSNGLHA